MEQCSSASINALDTNRRRRRSPGDSDPMVSVIVPTCNRPETLAASLESILKQTFQDFEILVINDGECEVEVIVNRYNDRGRMTYIKHGRNRGLAAARNSGLRLARGKYIAYLDDDDRFYPHHLETLVKALEQGQAPVAYTDAHRVLYHNNGDRDVAIGRDVPYSHEFDPRLMLVHNYIPVLCVMHARSCLDETGLFDESLSSHEDWDLWIRMSRRFPFLHIPTVTAEFAWKTDGSTMTSRMQSEYCANVKLIHRRYRHWVDGDQQILQAQEAFVRNLERDRSTSEVMCSIIMPVLGQDHLLRQCLHGLSQTLGTIPCEVIVVGNQSTDTIATLDGLNGNVRVIREEAHLGIAQAYNQGAKSARGRYLVFLHPDVIPQAGWLEPLLAELETHEEVGVVGNKLLNANGRIRHAGLVIAREECAPYRLYADAPADADYVNHRRERWAVTGACMAVRKSVFDRLRGFDEGYRDGFEDVDFCIRVWELGYRVVYQPQSVVTHLENQMVGRKDHDAEHLARFRQTWKDRLIEDEDLAYWEDGSVVVRDIVDGQPHRETRAFASDQERQCWAEVVAVQRHRLLDRLRTMRELFSDPSSWPTIPEILSWGAELCCKVGFTKEARQFWEHALTIEEKAEMRLRLATVALRQGDMQEAQRYLESVIEHDPDNGDAQVVQGIVAMQQHAYGDAQASFRRARACGVTDRRVDMGEGLAALGLGKSDEAWEAFTRVLQHNPDDHEAVHGLLRAGTAMEAWEPLRERLMTFLARNPSRCDVRFALAGVSMRAGRFAEAHSEYLKLKALQPDFEGLADLEAALARVQTEAASPMASVAR